MSASHHAASAESFKPGEPPDIHHMDAPTAYQAAKLGMWLFLATEILLFGGLFTAFALYHWKYFDEFHAASKHLNPIFGTINTVFLLSSSLTAALAVDAAQRGNNRACARNLLITLLCGVAFLVIKGIEYTDKYNHGYFPGTAAFNSADFNQHYKMYFGLYYAMTGLHALHVIIGMGVIAWVYLLARKARFSGRYYVPVELAALYWHLVDLIWIYLFPLLYLVG